MNLRFVLFLVLFTTGLSAQNGYLYIEPYTSIAYDTTVFKKGDRFSSGWGDKEEYRFNYIDKGKGNRFLVVSSEANIQNIVSLRVQDSVILATTANVVGPKDSDAVNADTALSHINGFSCMAFSVNYKELGVKSVMIVAARSYDWGLTKIVYTADNTIDKRNEFVLFEDFLKGVKMYSKEEIVKEEKDILSSYTTRVDSVPYVKLKSYDLISYKGIVGVNQKLKHKVIGAEILLNGGSLQEFNALIGSSSVEIFCMDKTEGKQDKTGRLILLNSFGKKVKVPFRFSYYNKL